MRGRAWAGGRAVARGAPELLSPASPPGGQDQMCFFQIERYHPTFIRLPVHPSTYLLTYPSIQPVSPSTPLSSVHPTPHSSFGLSAPLLSLCSLFPSACASIFQLSVHLPVLPSLIDSGDSSWAQCWRVSDLPQVDRTPWWV